MRGWRLLVLLALIACGLSGDARPVSGTMTAPSLYTSRSGHTATLLTDGRVLVAGGTTSVCTGCPQTMLTTSEIIDPARNSVKTAAPMVEPRSQHQALRLADGHVLIFGGWSEREPFWTTPRLLSAERYDPRRDRWTPAASLPDPSLTLGSAILLPDGDVLIAGGATLPSGNPYDTRGVTLAARYNPRSDQWTLIAPLALGRYGHELTLLPDGRVLATGGNTIIYSPTRGAEIYDPEADHWDPVASMRFARSGHRATLLPDGRVLVTGGGGKRIEPGPIMTEIYDPATDHWSEAGPLVADRAGHTATVRSDGRVYLFSGSATGMSSARRGWGEYSDPGEGLWHPFAGLDAPSLSTTTILPDETMLMIGGDTNGSLDIIAHFSPPALGQECFSSGFCIEGLFLDYWRAHGGLALIGMPISAAIATPVSSNMTFPVQYFERARFEFHTWNIDPPRILLGHLGREFAPQSAPSSPNGSGAYFPETGHNLGGDFLAYWQANGDLMQFGYPLTEEMEETLEDGNTYTVQYFERTRFERHPESAPGDVGPRSLPTLPVRSFYRAISYRDYKAAYAQLAPALQQQQSFADFAANYEQFFNFESTVTSVMLVAPTRAIVSIRLTAWKSQPYAASSFGGIYTTALIDGTWQIEQATIVQDPH